MRDLSEQRERMVQRQLAARGVADARVLEAMRQVPRERFVPEHLRELAYEDSALPIEAGQTISQPFIVALMAEQAAIGPSDRVLEVGAGSGYAAAVLARLARRVHAVERHASLADQARERLAELGVGNVEVRCGDGTLGWPEAAPFDAILVSAGGPDVPEALRAQLAPGGRLVMPVGGADGAQRLVKLVRAGPHGFRQEDLGAVRFVPLVGRQGWAEPAAAGAAPHSDASGATPQPAAASAAPQPAPAARPRTLPERLAQAAEPLPELDDAAFGQLFDRFAQGARVVLLGEASHGTSEFYRARARITRRLVEAHGFNIVAVEADWPDAAVINRQVRGLPPRDGTEPPFARFPTWMWRNAEVAAFTAWLAEHNRARAPARQAGFYGLDLYNLSGSVRAVIDYLDRTDPDAARVARERYGCLTPWQNAPQAYGRLALSRGYAPCEQAVVAMLRELLDRRMAYAAGDGETFLDATANARLVQNAEAYYRAMYHGSAESWNLRDRHMFDTLAQLLEAKGPESRAVVWAHNSHIGDARFAEMGWTRAQLNIGQLCRERFGREAALVGFGTHAGTVAAAGDWDEPMQLMRVRPSLADSYERVAHDSGVPRFLLDLRPGRHDALRAELIEPRLERFIGVIYRPDTERWSHYSSASLPQQFDAWVWFDETRAVTALPGPQRAGDDETYPFGL